MGESTRFGRDSTADEVLEGRDLSGSVALVTGASGGIGLETARTLAARGAMLIAAVRDVPRAEAALDAAGIPSGQRRVVELDLTSLASVRASSDAVLASVDRLDLVVANAGVMACPEGRTADGFETHMGTNHLGHFAFVNRLVPLLAEGGGGRVVVVSSSAHRFSDVDLDDLNGESRPYSSHLAYASSKTANILFAVELDRRWRERGARAGAVHPGSVITGLQRHLGDDLQEMLTKRPHVKSIPAGAATSVWAGVVATPDELGAHYCQDCQVAPVSDVEPDVSGAVGGGREGVRSYAVDPEHARDLWAVSEELVGERFD